MSFCRFAEAAKWGHLGDLHKAVKQVEPALVAGDSTVQSIGN